MEKYVKKILYSCGHEISVETYTKPLDEVTKVSFPCHNCREKEKSKQLTSDELKNLGKPLKAVSQKQKEYAEKNRDIFIRYWVKSASDRQADIIRQIIKNETAAGWWLDNLQHLKEDDFIDEYTPSKKKSKDNKKDNRKVYAKQFFKKNIKNKIIFPMMLGYQNTNLDNTVFVDMQETTIYLIPVTLDATFLSETDNLKYECNETQSLMRREITEFNGKIADRVVDVSLKLLEKGYPLILKDAAIRDRVLRKDTVQEPKKWFKLFNGILACLEWEGYNKELCSKALTMLPEASWNNDYKVVTVPIKYGEDIKRFAINNNIYIQNRLKELIERSPT